MKIEEIIDCDSYEDAVKLHNFVTKHGKPFIYSKIHESMGWCVVLWRTYGCSNIDQYYEPKYDGPDTSAETVKEEPKNDK